MHKIPTVFVRDPGTGLRHVRDEVTPGCEWVLAGEGSATRKYDGTAVLVRDGQMFKRYDLRPGKTAPEGFEPVEHDENTGKTFGWVPVGDGPEDKWHREAMRTCGPVPNGTYELVGPKIQGNPEGVDHHELVAHGWAPVDAPRDFAALGEWLHAHEHEGIVWWHPDGRRAKLKRRDYPSPPA